MNKLSTLEYFEGVFIKELSNRFLCEVEISGRTALCYVPSSCRLSNFMCLDNKKVLVVKNTSKSAKTEYALFAVKHKRNYILLNTSLANQIIEQQIGSKKFSFLGIRKNIYREKLVEGYKTDIFISDTNTILEIKSMISTENTANFLTIYSERVCSQLKKIQNLLIQGYTVYLIIVSLSESVKEINIPKNTYYYDELKKCMNLGMKLLAYSSVFDGKSFKPLKNLKIVFFNEASHLENKKYDVPN